MVFFMHPYKQSGRYQNVFDPDIDRTLKLRVKLHMNKQWLDDKAHSENAELKKKFGA
jgi:hypothetical protein